MKKLLLGALREERGDFLSGGQANDQAAAQHRVNLAVREPLAHEETRGGHEDPLIAVFDRDDGGLEVFGVPAVGDILEGQLGVALALGLVCGSSICSQGASTGSR